MAILSLSVWAASRVLTERAFHSASGMMSCKEYISPGSVAVVSNGGINLFLSVVSLDSSAAVNVNRATTFNNILQTCGHESSRPLVDTVHDIFHDTFHRIDINFVTFLGADVGLLLFRSEGFSEGGFRLYVLKF